MKTKEILLLLTLVFLTSCKGQNASIDDIHDTSEQATKGQVVDALGSSIMVVFQDRNKNYWFGSWETGLYRYDGKEMIHYTTDDGLASNRIDEIQEDSLGNVYLISCHPKSTVVKFDGTRFIRLIPRQTDDWKLQTSDLWFRHGYGNEKVYRYDGTTLHELKLPKPDGFTNPYEIYSIYKDRMGNRWFGTNPLGVCRYDGKKLDWITEADVTEFRNEGANGVRSITEDKNGDFWFNTENRYTIYNQTTLPPNSWYIRHKSLGSLDGKPGGPLDEFLSTVRDQQDNLWFVTYRDGVWKYDGLNITHYPVLKNGKNITLFSIYMDKGGNLWLGTHENGTYTFTGTEFVPFEPNK